MSIKSRKLLLGLGWATVAITIWSGSLVMLRLGVTTSLTPYDLTTLRFGTAALVIAPFALKRGPLPEKLGGISLVAMVAAFGAPYVMLIALAMKTAPAAAAGALNPGVMAIVSVLLSWTFSGEHIGHARFVGLGVTATGIFLFARTGGSFTNGHLILLGTGVMWASYSLIVRSAAVPAMTATAIVAVGSALIYLPVYILFLPKQILAAPLADILVQAGFQGMLVSVVAIYAFNRSAELLGSIAGATLPALIPVATLGFGVSVLGEVASLGELISAVLISTGVVLILVGKHATHWLWQHCLPASRRDAARSVLTSDGSEDRSEVLGAGSLKDIDQG